MSFQIIFTLQAVQKPSSIPVSLASLHLLRQSLGTFARRITDISYNVGNIYTRLSSIRKLYEAEKIPNKVVDGTIPFPENAQSIGDGISLEFKYFLHLLQICRLSFGICRNVSFQYPGSELYALRDTSFRVLPGQLCVRPRLPCMLRAYEVDLLCLRRVLGHSWFERIRQKHDSQACCSYI